MSAERSFGTASEPVSVSFRNTTAEVGTGSRCNAKIGPLCGLFSSAPCARSGHCLAPQLCAMSEGGKEMAENNAEREMVGAEDMAGEVRLWQAVVVRAIQDWMSGPVRQQHQAENYIFGGNPDFAVVCQSAGLNADDLRARLGRIRSGHSHGQQAIAA